jgi:hypothetical protein
MISAPARMVPLRKGRAGLTLSVLSLCYTERAIKFKTGLVSLSKKLFRVHLTYCYPIQ